MEQQQVEKEFREIQEAANLAMINIRKIVTDTEDPLWRECLEWAEDGIKKNEEQFTLFLYAYTQTLRIDGDK